MLRMLIRIGEAVLMSTHKVGFYEEISKIITYHQISSNTHLISSAEKFFLFSGSQENMAKKADPEQPAV